MEHRISLVTLHISIWRVSGNMLDVVVSGSLLVAADGHDQHYSACQVALHQYEVGLTPPLPKHEIICCVRLETGLPQFPDP